MFHDIEEYAKFEEKLTCGLGNVMRNLANIYQVTRKSQNWDFDGPFIQRRKCLRLKITEELCIMTMKNDAKFEEVLTCGFKIDTTT